MEQPTKITPYDYKDKFTSFSVVKMHASRMPFTDYNDALAYLKEIVKNDPECDMCWLEGHSDELGTEMIQHVYLREILTYSYPNKSK